MYEIKCMETLKLFFPKISLLWLFTLSAFLFKVKPAFYNVPIKIKNSFASSVIFFTRFFDCKRISKKLVFLRKYRMKIQFSDGSVLCFSVYIYFSIWLRFLKYENNIFSFMKKVSRAFAQKIQLSLFPSFSMSWIHILNFYRFHRAVVGTKRT